MRCPVTLRRQLTLLVSAIRRLIIIVVDCKWRKAALDGGHDHY